MSYPVVRNRPAPGQRHTRNWPPRRIADTVALAQGEVVPAVQPGPILFVVSVTMIAMGDLMLVPALVGWWSGGLDYEPFLDSAAFTLVPALVMYALFRQRGVNILPRHAFLITTLVWIVAAVAGSVPIALHEHISFTDAFFESMSGITTTGSTVLAGLDEMSPAILLWRSLLQWVGGLGFMLMAVAILPMVGVGGMRLFRSESSDWSEKSLPRARDIASRIGLLYAGLSMLCALFYWLFGMSAFDAINHSMTTISTGGYSTSDASMGKYDSNAMLWISSSFMLLGSLPFLVLVHAFKAGPGALVRDEQVRFFLLMVAVISLLSTLLLNDPAYSLGRAFTVVTFNVVSTITTTGFASTDYTLWGPFFAAEFLFLMFTGGCSGSTAGSVKIFRIQLALKMFATQIRKLIHPNGVFVVRLNNRRVDPSITSALVAFIFAIGLTVIVLTVALAAMGLDLVTALSSSVTAVTNVGPGLGDIVGPAGNFASLPDAAKWLLAGAMLLGRLELMTVFVLVTKAYWRG
ncbi:MAG: TrkH family potassium uptake protein [Pseudomonadales bacterium]